jgi:hypothetical protein
MCQVEHERVGERRRRPELELLIDIEPDAPSDLVLVGTIVVLCRMASDTRLSPELIEAHRHAEFNERDTNISWLSLTVFPFGSTSGRRPSAFHFGRPISFPQVTYRSFGTMRMEAREAVRRCAGEVRRIGCVIATARMFIGPRAVHVNEPRLASRQEQTLQPTKVQYVPALECVVELLERLIAFTPMPIAESTFPVTVKWRWRSCTSIPARLPIGSLSMTPCMNSLMPVPLGQPRRSCRTAAECSAPRRRARR